MQDTPSIFYIDRKKKFTGKSNLFLERFKLDIGYSPAVNFKNPIWFSYFIVIQKLITVGARNLHQMFMLYNV